MQDKKVLAGMLALLLSCGWLPLFSLDEAARKQIDSLVRDGKPLSAWQAIERLDPGSEDPDAILARARCFESAVAGSMGPEGFQLRDGSGEASTLAYRLAERLGALGVQYPDSAAAWTALGNYHYRAGLNNGPAREADLKAARAAYQKARTLGADDPRLAWRLGMLEHLLGEAAKALAWLKEAQAALPREPGIGYDLAYVLYSQKRWTEAQAQAAGLAQAGSGRLQLQGRLLQADCLLAQKKYREAQALYDLALKDEPDNLYPLRRIIECNLGQGDARNLEKLTQQYAEGLPSSPASLEELTLLYIKSDKQDLIFSTTRALKAKYAQDQAEVAGLMAFYEALVYHALNKKKETLAALDESERYLGDHFPADHPLTLKAKELRAKLR